MFATTAAAMAADAWPLAGSAIEQPLRESSLSYRYPRDKRSSAWNERPAVPAAGIALVRVGGRRKIQRFGCSRHMSGAGTIHCDADPRFLPAASKIRGIDQGRTSRIKLRDETVLTP